jgi:hypothetical protein
MHATQSRTRRQINACKLHRHKGFTVFALLILILSFDKIYVSLLAFLMLAKPSFLFYMVWILGKRLEEIYLPAELNKYIYKLIQTCTNNPHNYFRNTSLKWDVIISFPHLNLFFKLSHEKSWQH